MTTRANTGERLARIETLLEEGVIKEIGKLSEDVKAIRADLDKDKADLAALKNKGAGILIGVGLAGGAAGAGFVKLWQGVFS